MSKPKRDQLSLFDEPVTEPGMIAPLLTTSHQGEITVIEGDCVEAMAKMPDNSIDAIVTDPPYGLEFMGKEWDSFRKRDPNIGQMSREGFSVPSGTPDQRERNKGGTWFGSREATVPNYTRTTNVKCRTCGKWKVSGAHDGKGNTLGCQCEIPDFPDARAEAGRGYGAWCEQWAIEALRVLKPGGHMVAFGGTRTYHRLACAVEDAGFEIRDCLQWLYGSGFPKSLDVSKAIDKADARSAPPDFASWLRLERERRGLTAHELCERGKFYKHVNHGGLVSNWEAGIGTPNVEQFNLLCDLLDLPFDRRDEVKREILGWRPAIPGVAFTSDGPSRLPITAPTTEAAIRWQGYGTALKPANEPILLARKPLIGTVAANVLEHGTGALNIDATRVGYEEGGTLASNPSLRTHVNGGNGGHIFGPEQDRRAVTPHSQGRWPANVILGCACEGDHEADCPVRLLDEQSGASISRIGKPRASKQSGPGWGMTLTGAEYEDGGGASRFFYTAKASRAERTLGDGSRSSHPTVKPIELMRWLARLVTPPGGIVLDPFAGSGSTLIAASREGFASTGIEKEASYAAIIRDRMEKEKRSL